MLITLAGLVSLPADIYEAAQIDGASPWQAFWRITLPLVRPTVVAAAMLRFMDSVKTFDQIYVTTRGGRHRLADAQPVRFRSGLSVPALRVCERAPGRPLLRHPRGKRDAGVGSQGRE